MKTRSVCFLVLFCVLANFSCNAQIWNSDYSTSPGAWNWVPTSPPANGEIFFSNRDSCCYIHRLHGWYRDTRIWEPLGFMLQDIWTMKFDWTVTDVAPHGGGIVIPLVVTAGKLAPLNPDSSILQTDQDAIGVICHTPPGIDNPISLFAFAKDGSSVFTYSCSITIYKDSLYYVELRRLSWTLGELIVRNSDGSPPVSCCFKIPATVTGLQFVQTANVVEAGTAREISAHMCRAYVEKGVYPCCNPRITHPAFFCDTIGPDTICLVSDILNIDPATNLPYYLYNWSFPTGVVCHTIDNSNCIVITSWGNHTGTVVFTVTWECQCEKYTLTDSITIDPNLALLPYAYFSRSDSTDCFINKVFWIKGVATNTPLPPGAHEKWEIFRSNNCTPGDTTHFGAPLRPPGYDVSTYKVDSFYCDTCYLLRHSVWIEASCPPVSLYYHEYAFLKKHNIIVPTTPKDQLNRKNQNGVDGDKIKIFPNPTGNSLNLEFGAFNIRVSKVVLSEQSGKEIREQKTNGESSLVLTVEDLSPGVYTLSFYSGERLIISKQFIKN